MIFGMKPVRAILKVAAVLSSLLLAGAFVCFRVNSASPQIETSAHSATKSQAGTPRPAAEPADAPVSFQSELFSSSKSSTGATAIMNGLLRLSEEENERVTTKLRTLSEPGNSMTGTFKFSETKSIVSLPDRAAKPSPSPLISPSQTPTFSSPVKALSPDNPNRAPKLVILDSSTLGLTSHQDGNLFGSSRSSTIIKPRDIEPVFIDPDTFSPAVVPNR